MRRIAPIKRLMPLRERSKMSSAPVVKKKSVTGFLSEVEQWPCTTLAKWALAVFSAWVLFKTSNQISLDLVDRQEERQHRMEERVDRAMTRLMEPTGGMNNKGWALGVLLGDPDISTERIDLSCQAVGVFEGGKCVSRPIFYNVDIQSFADIPVTSSNEIPFAFKDLTDTQFSYGTFDGMRFYIGNMLDTWFVESSFIATNFYGVASRTTSRVFIVNSDLSFTTIDGKAGFFGIINSNLSGAKFLLDKQKKRDEEFDDRTLVHVGDRSWAWADFPPTETDFDIMKTFRHIDRIILCDPKDASDRSFRLTNYSAVHVPATGIKKPDDCKVISAAEAARKYPKAYIEWTIDNPPTL